MSVVEYRIIDSWTVLSTITGSANCCTIDDYRRPRESPADDPQASAHLLAPSRRRKTTMARGQPMISIGSVPARPLDAVERPHAAPRERIRPSAAFSPCLDAPAAFRRTKEESRSRTLRSNLTVGMPAARVDRLLGDRPPSTLDAPRVSWRSVYRMSLYRGHPPRVRSGSPSNQ